MVRSIQEMSKNVESVDALIEEFSDVIRNSITVLRHFQALKEHGVKYVDPDTFEPVVPDNVLVFPSERMIQ